MSAAYLKVKAPHFEHKKDCTGKHAYVSREEGRHACVLHGLKHEVYHCDHCAHWHTRPTPRR